MLADEMVTPRTWVTIGLVAVVVALAFLLTRASRERVKAEGAADVYAAQYEAAADSLEVSRAARVEADSQRVRADRDAAADIAAANARRIQAEQRSDAAAARRPEVIERVVQTYIQGGGADSVVLQSAIQEVADSIVQHEVMPLKAALAATDAIRLSLIGQLAAADAQIAARDRVQADLEAALAASLGEAAELRDALPGWFSRNAPKLLVPAAFVAGWVLSERIGG